MPDHLDTTEPAGPDAQTDLRPFRMFFEALDLQPDRYGEPALYLDESLLPQIRFATKTAWFAWTEVEADPREVFVLTKATRLLIRRNHLVAAAHLAASATDPRITVLEIKALLALGTTEAVKSSVEKTARRKDLPQWVRLRLLDTKHRVGMPLTEADHAAYLPEIPETLSEALSNLNPRVTDTDIAIGKALLPIRAIPGETPRDLAKAITWGRAADQYLNFLRYFGAQTLQETEGARRIKALSAASHTIVEFPDLRPLRHAIRQGRSVAMLCAHSTSVRFALPLAKMLGIPTALISADGHTDLSPDAERKILGLDGMQSRNFAKLTKLIKKEPHFVKIAADGKKGAERETLDVFGSPVDIGVGMTTVIWHSNALVVFCRPEWENGHLHIRLDYGPSRARHQGERDLFDARLLAFYRHGLERIVKGPPENMGVTGGFWTQLLGDWIRANGRPEMKD